MERRDTDEPAEAVGDETISPRTTTTSRLQTFEDCSEAIDDLFQRSLTSKGTAGFDEFLEFAARFSHMAVFNAMMVKVQRPGSVLAASRRQWAEIGRHPLPDAVPIAILRPFGPLSFVYDLGDTGGEDFPIGSPNPFTAVGPIGAADFHQYQKSAEANGVLVESTDLYGTALAGTAAAIERRPDQVRDGQFWWRIRVNSHHEAPVQLATLAHELGHVYCGHVGGHPKGHWPERKRLHYELMELEAESVAWIVCQRRGVTPNSPEYLSSLVSRTKLSEASIWAIYAAANRVESGTTGRSRPR